MQSTYYLINIFLVPNILLFLHIDNNSVSERILYLRGIFSFSILKMGDDFQN